MTADVENLILERLCRIDGRLDTVQNDIGEIKNRLGHLDRGQAELAPQYATLSIRVVGSTCVFIGSSVDLILRMPD